MAAQVLTPVERARPAAFSGVDETLIAPRSLFGLRSASGDHASDLPVLDLVGNPVVVGDHPVPAPHACRKGWARLPGVNTLIGAAT